MSRLIMLAAIVALVFGIFGYFKADHEGQFAVPDAIKAIECQKDSKFLAPEAYDVFRLMGTTLVMACQKPGSGKSWATLWQSSKALGPDNNAIERSTTYYFMKRPDGRFARTNDALSYSPASGVSRYVVVASIYGETPEPFDKDIFGKHWEMQLPTPSAFAATGPETTFWCQDPGIHYQMFYRCVARTQTKGLYWHIHIVFGKPLRNEAGEFVKSEEGFDMRPEVTEAYNFLAAHILKQD